MKKTLKYILSKKASKIPVTMATAYDFPTAQLQDQAGMDCILIGDSLGTNVLGYESERQVTMDDMLHHTAAVARGVQDACILADLPFGSTETSEFAMENASKLVNAGADCVKIEGWHHKLTIIKELVQNGFSICAHIGYNPQIHDKPKTFGKDATQALELLKAAQALQDAGACMLVLEKIPHEIAAEISFQLEIPTIGIGSGNGCDGQVLVVNDLLGLSSRKFRHVQTFADLREIELSAFKSYIQAIETRIFPSEENTVRIGEAELQKFRSALR